MKTVSILVFVGLACVVHSHVSPAESEDFFSTEIDGEKTQRSVEDPEEPFDPVEEENDSKMTTKTNDNEDDNKDDDEDDNEDDNEGDNKDDEGDGDDGDEIDAELEQPDR